MPIDEHISTPGAAKSLEIPVNTPDAPTYLGSAKQEIDILINTGDNGFQTLYDIEVEEDGVSGNYVEKVEIYNANDVLVFTSDQGGPVNIDIDDGRYDPANAATTLQTALNANTTLTGTGTITFVVTSDANQFTIDAGTGHTIAFTYSGSDGAAVWGFTGNIAAAQTITGQTYGTFNKMVTPITGSCRNTIGDWGSTIIRVMGLSTTTSPKPYRFRVIAHSQNLTYSATSAWSEIMVPRIDLALGPLSTAASYECTTGDCKISGLTVTEKGDSYPGQWTISYTLTRVHNVATKCSVTIGYCTTIDGTYTNLSYPTDIAETMENLTASAAGTAVTHTWATCVTVGNSYYNTLYLKVTPYDAATTAAGDAGTAATTTIAIDNRPNSITIAEFSAFTWDKDTTPEFVADMASVVCGNYLYFICRVYNSSGTEVFTFNSAERPAGWYYEADHAGSPGSSTRNAETGWDTNWTACTYAGVASTLAPPTVSGNRIRYILQDALTQGQSYTVKIQQAEYISELI